MPDVFHHLGTNTHAIPCVNVLENYNEDVVVNCVKLPSYLRTTLFSNYLRGL